MRRQITIKTEPHTFPSPSLPGCRSPGYFSQGARHQGRCYSAKIAIFEQKRLQHEELTPRGAPVEISDLCILRFLLRAKDATELCTTFVTSLEPSDTRIFTL